MLAAAWGAQDLTEVHLARCGLSREGLANLLVGRARHFRRLDLSGNGLERRDLMRLVDSPVLANVSISVTGVRPPAPRVAASVRLADPARPESWKH